MNRNTIGFPWYKSCIYFDYRFSLNVNHSNIIIRQPGNNFNLFNKMMGSAKCYNFLIADAHIVIRVGLSLVIKEMFLDASIKIAGNCKDIFELLKEFQFDLLILEVNFPDGNSINMLSVIKTIQPDLKILIFSTCDENIYAIRYLSAGASGYLSKEATEDKIKNAINNIIIYGKYIGENIKEQILDSYIKTTKTNPLDVLSNREIEVVYLLIEGYRNDEILELLKIKKTTISTYKNRIFKKLKIHNVVDLIKIFQLYNNEQ